MGKNNKKAWEVIADKLSKEILASKYPANVALPGEHDLCESFTVSRTTVRRAMADLEKRGLVYRQAGRGTFAYPVQDMHVPPVALLIKIADKMANSFFMELIHGCNSYLYSIGSHVSILAQSPCKWSQTQLKSLAGVIIIPAGVEAEELSVLDASKCGYITIMESDIPGPTVKMEPQKAAYELTNYILDKGHRKIALISGHHQHADKLKRKGIAQALANVGINLQDVPDVCTGYDQQRAHQGALKLLDTSDKPTAIIGFNDALALQAITVAGELGINVPKQLSVAGFNNSPFGTLSIPPLTTINFPIYEAGRIAAQQLTSHYLHGKKLQSATLTPELIIRQSVVKLASMP